MGFPSSGAPEFGGRTLNALSRKVETPYPTIEPEVRRRVEEFIGCTLEQSYSEFTMELKNAVHRIMDDIYHTDHSKPARHRGHAKRHQYGTRRVS
jgi:hypothetical protein